MLIRFFVLLLILNAILSSAINIKYPENQSNDENDVVTKYNYDNQKFYKKNSDQLNWNDNNENHIVGNDYFNFDYCSPHCFITIEGKQQLDKIFEKHEMNILLWAAQQIQTLYKLNELKFANQFNLSGQRQGPLLVDEPKFIVIRREDDFSRSFSDYSDDPFIPPRGRKHLPELKKLLQRNDLFVPNRGKKDKIKDIFKYDDLFFPNRGKRSMSKVNGGHMQIKE